MQDNDCTCVWCNPLDDSLQPLRYQVIEAIDAIAKNTCEDCEVDSKICRSAQFLEQLAELVATTPRDRVQRHWSLPTGRRDISE